MSSNATADETGSPNPAGTACRFCGRAPAPGQHRVSGPRGPICASCIETGLRLTVARKPDLDDESMSRVDPHDDTVCEFCDRNVRLSFLGFRRTLYRAASTTSDAVICAGCLDWAGNLLNRAITG